MSHNPTVILSSIYNIKLKPLKEKKMKKKKNKKRAIICVILSPDTVKEALNTVLSLSLNQKVTNTFVFPWCCYRLIVAWWGLLFFYFNLYIYFLYFFFLSSSSHPIIGFKICSTPHMRGSYSTNSSDLKKASRLLV